MADTGSKGLAAKLTDRRNATGPTGLLFGDRAVAGLLTLCDGTKDA
jgi:hypothetical protein